MGAMDDIYGLLVTVDYPDGVTGGLRRTTDALRARARAHPRRPHDRDGRGPPPGRDRVRARRHAE